MKKVDDEVLLQKCDNFDSDTVDVNYNWDSESSTKEDEKDEANQPNCQPNRCVT